MHFPLRTSTLSYNLKTLQEGGGASIEAETHSEKLNAVPPRLSLSFSFLHLHFTAPPSFDLFARSLWKIAVFFFNSQRNGQSRKLLLLSLSLTLLPYFISLFIKNSSSASDDRTAWNSYSPHCKKKSIVCGKRTVKNENKQILPCTKRDRVSDRVMHLLLRFVFVF